MPALKVPDEQILAACQQMHDNGETPSVQLFPG